MSEVTSLYGTLASSASIFLGIIAALLVNRIISTETERAQLKQRVGRINSQRKSIKQRRDEIDGRLEAVIDSRHRTYRLREANEDLDDFIKTLGNRDFDTDSQNLFFEVRDEFREFVGEGEWDSIYHYEALQVRYSDVRSELEVDEEPTNRVLQSEIRKLREEVEKGNYQQVQDRRVADRRSLNRRLSELENLYEWIDARFDSLQLGRYRESVEALILSLLFSVVIPIVFFAAHVIGPIETNVPYLPLVERIAVFVFWLGGLAIVVNYLWCEVRDDPDEGLESLSEVEINTFGEALPNLIPEDIPDNEVEKYIHDQIDPLGTTHSESEQNTDDTTEE